MQAQFFGRVCKQNYGTHTSLRRVLARYSFARRNQRVLHKIHWKLELIGHANLQWIIWLRNLDWQNPVPVRVRNVPLVQNLRFCRHELLLAPAEPEWVLQNF